MAENKFEYTYTAPTEQERCEIRQIRRRYEAPDPTEGRLARLRKLDARVHNLPMCTGLVLGVVGLLVFGLGIALILEWEMIALGVIVGVIGAVPMGLAYPLYLRTLAHLKQKHGEEILRLSDELLASEEEAHTES